MSEHDQLEEPEDLEEHTREPEPRGRDFEHERGSYPDSDPDDFYEERLR